MAKKILIIGKSGSGKSSSLRNLDPKTTAIIKCQSKEIPFKKGDANFKSVVCKSAQEIGNMVAKVLKEAPHIKNIIIDDLFYLSSHQNFQRVSEKGYNKFTEMAKEVYDVITLPDLIAREDLTFVFITHSETNAVTLETDVKTIGKMLDSQLNIAGLFTMVLEAHAMTIEGAYKFKTHNIDGNSVVKTPMGMFEDDFIDNDVTVVLNAMKEYY